MIFEISTQFFGFELSLYYNCDFQNSIAETSNFTTTMTADTLSLPNKVAIVTGSGRENGIGAAIAASLAKNGASVVINYISEATAPRAQKVAEGIKATGGKVVVIQGDVSKPGDAKALVEGTLKAFNAEKIDILGMHSKILKRRAI
jgi:NAD(P)-dependent dehydrogenase (short-subunit alcohol dehydrogenase family)